MLLKPACEQLTLVQSDISPIDIASVTVIVIKHNFYRVVSIKSVYFGYSD